MTVHKLKESIAVGQTGRGQGQGGGWGKWGGGAVGVVHHYHGRQFRAQPNKITDVIIISLLDVKWEEAAFVFVFSPQSETSVLRKKSGGQSTASITLLQLLQMVEVWRQDAIPRNTDNLTHV